MMKFLLGTLFFSIALSVAGQQRLSDTGFIDKTEAKNLKVNGLKEGKWIEYYKDYNHKGKSGVKKSKVFHTHQYTLTIYKADKPYGITRQYINGKLFCITPYADGKVDGVVKTYFNNGNIESAFSYSNDNLNGVMRWYYESGELQSETFWNMDKKTGIGKTYYENGQLSDETNYDSSNIVKKHTESRKLDTLAKRIYADSSGNNYTEKNYDENGLLFWETLYINKKENGIQKGYYGNGKLKCEITYTKGAQTGPEKEYYLDGKLWKEYNNVSNKKDGIYKEYYETGELEYQVTYSKGKVKSTKSFDKNGKEIK